MLLSPRPFRVKVSPRLCTRGSGAALPTSLQWCLLRDRDFYATWAQYYAPSDSCEDIGTFVGLSLTYSPLPLAFLTGLPCSQERTQAECCRWRVAEHPVPALGLPRL